MSGGDLYTDADGNFRSPEAAAAHAITVQGGFSTPAREARRMVRGSGEMGRMALKWLADHGLAVDGDDEPAALGFVRSMLGTAASELAAPLPPLPDSGTLRRHALKVAIYEARASEAKDNVTAVRSAAELVFGPARQHGTPQVELTAPDGTKLGLISIQRGAQVIDTDEDRLTAIIACNDPSDFEDIVKPSAVHDPRVLALLAEHLPELVTRRVRPDRRALYDTEIAENGGTVLDRLAGERVRVATITSRDATGKFSFRASAKGAQLIREALDAGVLTEDGEWVTGLEAAADGALAADAAGRPAITEAPMLAIEASVAPARPAPPADDTDSRISRALGRPVGPAIPRPTDQQQAILDAVATGANVAVRALAGTGKTTLLQQVGVQERNRPGMYMAFGADIVQEAKDEGKFGPDIRVTTAHGIAMGATGRKYRAKMDRPYIPMQDVAQILRINSPQMIGGKKLTPARIASVAMRTVEKFCQSADPELTAEHVAAPPGLSGPEHLTALEHVVLPWAQRAWADLTGVGSGQLRVWHPHYLKIWQLTSPRIRADYIAVDEAQDLHPVILDVLLRQSAQIIPVGDDNQAIFEWMGSVNSLDQFKVEHDLALTQSYRFGHAIAGEANKWLEVLDSPLRVRGWDRRSSMVTKLATSDAILCRSNAGALAEIVRSVTEGQRTALAGGDKAAGELRRLAEAAADLTAGNGTTHPELVAFQTWRQVQEYAEEDAGGTFRTLVRIVDEHGPARIIEIVGQLRDEADASVVVSTAHKSKGRQWYSVRISDDFREPADGIEPEEGRLAYVAVTRAMGSLDPGSLGYINDHVAKRGAA